MAQIMSPTGRNTSIDLRNEKDQGVFVVLSRARSPNPQSKLVDFSTRLKPDKQFRKAFEASNEWNYKHEPSTSKDEVRRAASRERDFTS